MKIAYLIDDTLDSNDGVQQYVLTLGKWFEEQGHEVYYLCGQSYRTDLNNLHSLSSNIKVKFNKNRLSIPVKTRKNEIKKILNDEKFDIVHVQAPYSPLFSGKVLKNLPPETKSIATFHILPYSFLEKQSTRLLGSFVRRTNDSINKFISVSKPAQVFCKDYFGMESIVVPNPVDISKFTIKRINPYPDNQIVFLGRLVERKGPIKLIEAFALLSNDLDVKLTLYGDGPLRSQCQDLIDELNLSKNVKLAGYIDEKNKGAILSSSKIAIFPSSGGESFGIVLTEAMAAGAGVVLGGDNPGYRSVLADNRALFNPDNPQEIANTITTFLKNENLFCEIHNKQQQLVKQYDVDIVGKKVEHIYKTVIEKK